MDESGQCTEEMEMDNVDSDQRSGNLMSGTRRIGDFLGIHLPFMAGKRPPKS